MTRNQSVTPNDNTPNQAGEGKPTNNKTQHFSRAKTAMSRDNLERGYMSATDHVWHGMNDLLWALTHPHLSIPRGTGQLVGLVAIASVFGAVGYLFFGDPGSAKLSLQEPSSILKVTLDNTVRPATRWIKGAGQGAVDGVVGKDDEYNNKDYRD